MFHLVAHLQYFLLNIRYEFFFAKTFVLPLFALFFDEVFVDINVSGATWTSGVQEAAATFGLLIVFLY